MTDVVEAIGLTKIYGATPAVVDLDLRVAGGQCFGFLGPNGAGKTTTIRMLLALQRPTRGRARILDLDARADAVEVHRRVGYLPGELTLYPRMTGRDHLEWFARARGQRDLTVAEEITERFKVILDRPTRELSKGNRQKIGLVLAFMHQPDLLVLDEPTSGLDPLLQDEFERLVGEVVAEGRTVFLSSHELDEVQRLADRVGIIKAGRLLTVDTVARLRESAPRRVEARFTRAINPSLFAGMAGVSVTGSGETKVALEVTGPIGPVLKVIAEHDPLDVTARHADLDELFRELYSDSSEEVAHGAR